MGGNRKRKYTKKKDENTENISDHDSDGSVPKTDRKKTQSGGRRSDNAKISIDANDRLGLDQNVVNPVLNVNETDDTISQQNNSATPSNDDK